MILLQKIKQKIYNYFTIFRNINKLSQYDIDIILKNEYDQLIEDKVNEKYTKLVKKVTELVDRNDEILQKLKTKTFLNRKRPDVALRNMQGHTKETRHKLKEAWKIRKERDAQWKREEQRLGEDNNV